MASPTVELVRELVAKGQVEAIVDLIDARDKQSAALRADIESLNSKLARIQHSFMFHSNALAEICRATRAAQRTHTASHALF